MASVADYTGRTVDMACFQVVLPSGVQLLAQELVGRNGGTIVAGIQKLAQRVLLILLTRVGSQQYRPTFGTTFMLDAVTGAWRTVADVEQSFYAARVDVRRQVQADETEDDPADERYSKLDLIGVTLNKDKVSITMRLLSLAGTEFTYITPIEVPLT